MNGFLNFENRWTHETQGQLKQEWSLQGYVGSTTLKVGLLPFFYGTCPNKVKVFLFLVKEIGSKVYFGRINLYLVVIQHLGQLLVPYNNIDKEYLNILKVKFSIYWF